jgi:ectoine hydroxylase-related dioxygenase (phytanoyl-CoA dioxygenase family)
VHQDWTFVDEPEFTSATVWCPLVDVDESNGTLVLYRGSHLLGPSWRGSPRLPSRFDGQEDEIRSAHGTPVRCRAGQAVVYDHRVVHWSGPNRSEDPPQATPLIHLHAEADGSVTRYEVPDDFLGDLEFGAPPSRFASSAVLDVRSPTSRRRRRRFRRR